ncbi:hypothetical protein BA895_19835 [Humibacillus sp. DSM 29435]|nr:hypothetical protein BA895_19835 [Humibacillus sp. DSM 29435]
MLGALDPQGPVLEVGCGTGLVTRQLVEGGRVVISLDADPVMIRHMARHGVRGVTQADAAQLPLADASFPNVVLANVLHVVEDPSAVLLEAMRVASPLGRVVVTWPVDRLHPQALSRTERRLGRSRAGAARANLLRIITGVPGAALRVRRWRTSDLAQHLDDARLSSAWEPLDARVVHGTVHLNTYAIRERSASEAVG